MANVPITRRIQGPAPTSTTWGATIASLPSRFDPYAAQIHKLKPGESFTIPKQKAPAAVASEPEKSSLSKEAREAYERAIARYGPGGGFGKGVEAGLARGGKKAMASGMQALVSAGLAGTTEAAGLGKKYEEEVAAPTRARVEEARAQAISRLEESLAGAIQRGYESAEERKLRSGLATQQFDVQKELAGMQARTQIGLAGTQTSAQRELAGLQASTQLGIAGMRAAPVAPVAPTAPRIPGRTEQRMTQVTRPDLRIMPTGGSQAEEGYQPEMAPLEPYGQTPDERALLEMNRALSKYRIPAITAGMSVGSVPGGSYF